MDSTTTSHARLQAILDTLQGSSQETDLDIELLQLIEEAILRDPGLPRPNPTISLWQEPINPEVGSIQSRQLRLQTDFVVIGSGITGCSVVRTLLDHHSFADQHVTLLEARTLVSGATGRNGGHLVSAAGHTYADLRRRYGEENAKSIVRFSIMNINHILAMVRDLDGDLQDYSQVRDLVKVMVAGDESVWQHCKSSLAEFKAAIPEHENYHTAIEGAHVAGQWNVGNAHGAIEHRAGAVWPYRLLTAIFQRMLQNFPSRFAIETNTPATGITVIEGETDHPYAIQTPRGVIRTKKVIHCTNAFAAHLLPTLAGKVYPFRGTMTVQQPGSKLPNVGASKSWSWMDKVSLDGKTGIYKTGLYYLQQNAQTADIWVGTETSNILDILQADDTYVTREALQALTDFLPRYFYEGWTERETTKLKGVWTGVQGHTADGLPLVGKLPASITQRDNGQGEWIAAGFNGYGMDKCWLTGEALVKMIAGEDVSSWFPELYLITDRRFREDLDKTIVLQKFASIARTGSW